MSGAWLVIIAAAAREAAAVRRALRVRARRRLGPRRCWVGKAGGGAVALLRAGVGPEWAAAAAREATEAFRPTRLVVLGFAGSLLQDVLPGSLIVAERTRPDGSDGPDLVTVAADAGMVRAAVAAGQAVGVPTVCGTLITVPALAATPGAKAALAASTGAVAVDMEAGAVATVAARAGLPFLAAKIVFDAAGEPLHPALMDVVRPDGTPRLLHAAGLAARDKDARAALHWAGRRSRLAATALTRFCRAFLPLLSGAGERGPGDSGIVD
jgi:nucleoside phosphorylase